MNGVQTAQQLREKGNALYKKGKLSQAIKTYQDAARHAGDDDYLPWSNLSAAYFEAGQYKQAATSALRALALCRKKNNNEKEAASLEKKLAPRVIRSYLHTHQFVMARQWLDKCETSAAADELHQYRSSLDRAEAVWEAAPDEKRLRRDLAAMVPRYRPQYCTYPSYFSVGNDDIIDMLDASVLKDQEKDVSMFFAGIGDARHFYGQVVVNMASERMATALPVHRRYHFCMNDLKAGTFARNLVLFAILDELAMNKDMPQAQRTELYTVVYFLYLGAIVPRFVVARLDGVIDMIIEKLENCDSGCATVVLPWVQLYPSDRPEIVRALKSWKSDGSLLSQYSAESSIESALPGLHFIRSSRTTEDRPPPGCEKEMEMFFEVPFLQPPRSMLKEHEPELLGLLDEPASVQKLKSYLTVNWVTNPTLLDEDWNGKAGCDHFTSWNPFLTYEQFSQVLSFQEKGGPRKTKLFDHVSSFFRLVVVALRRIRGRLTAEFLLGDAADMMDAVRHGLIESRDATAPAAFDLIHLSNVPDYIGGSFFTFTTAAKILENSQAAQLNATCLRNTTLWKSQDEFHCEYMAVSDAKMLSRVAEVQLTGKEGDYPPFPMTGYRQWRRSHLETPAFQYEDLLPRAELTRFLYMHFFKLALPCGRSRLDNNRRNYVRPSLNLSCFFRLLIHLHELGYPAHWLADVLSNIVANQVVTTARPPRSLPLQPQELSHQNNNSNAKVCVGPFVGEMSTLTVLFHRILPFTPISHALPSIDMIHQYSMKLNWLGPTEEEGEGAAMVLFFFDFEIHFPVNIRDDLDPSSSTSVSKALNRFREHGCVVITSFTCTGLRLNRTVEFWMREDVMDRIQQQQTHWSCAVWRADDWQRLTIYPEDVSLLVKGKKWSNGKCDDVEMNM